MDTKAWYLSRGIWGSLVVIICMLLKQFGHDISPDMQGQMVDLCITVVTTVGAILALVGRIRATTKVAIKKPPAQ